jgi:hypothetical protein
MTIEFVHPTACEDAAHPLEQLLIGELAMRNSTVARACAACASAMCCSWATIACWSLATRICVVADSGHTGSDTMRAEALAATERFKMRSPR